MAIAWESSVPASYRSAFVEKVIAVSNRLLIDPSWLMIVMYFESARSFQPYVKNPSSGAVGLIQFLPSTATGLGTTTAKLAAMSAVDQLDYVEKYLKPYRGKMTDLYNLYLAIFAPAYIGRPDAQKVYASPSAAYTSNKALDTNNDGIISVGEIKSVISRYIPTGFSAGSTTTEQTVFPVAIIAIVIVVLFFILKRS